MDTINPKALRRPSGYNHGVRCGGILWIAGQTAHDADGKLQGTSIVDQFDRALANVLQVVREAGGNAASIGRLVIYVTDVEEYKRRSKEIGRAYRARMGNHYPAITCVEVSKLYDPGALIEIEATGIL